MSLLMPDINLRRKRNSIENFWMLALKGEDNHNGETNKSHFAPQFDEKTIRRPEQPNPYHRVDPQPSQRVECISRQAPPVNHVKQSKRQPVQAPTSVTVKTQDGISEHDTPPGSNRNQEITPITRYIRRVQGPTLGFVLNRIRLNEGIVIVLDFSTLSSKNKRLEAHGGELVARVLMTNHTVKRVIMRDHAIGDVGAIALANMLRYNSTLEYIDLYGNNITDVGAEALAKVLYGNESLTHLSMWSNAITNTGAEMLAAALRCNRRLKYLGLVHNRITKIGAEALLDALEVNMSLEVLNLATNRIPAATTSQIRVSLARNRLEAPKLLSMMRLEEQEVDQRVFELHSTQVSNYTTINQNENDESNATRSQVDPAMLTCEWDDEDFDGVDTCSEASGFMSCSDAEDDDTSNEECSICVWL